MEIKKVAPEKIKGASNCVFLSVTADLTVQKEYGEPITPAAILVFRWDSTFGFPGGKVEDKETLREALDREVSEEVGWKIAEWPLETGPSFSFEDKGKTIVTHQFVARVTEKEFFDLKNTAILDPREICGIVSFYAREKAAHQINGQPTVAEELRFLFPRM